MKNILIIGKRGGILQWYENLLASDLPNQEYNIQGFALNHNNNLERTVKKLISNKDKYTANLLKKKLAGFQPDLILIADLFYFNEHLLKVLHESKAKKVHWIGDFFDERLLKSKDVIDLYCFTDSSFIEDAQKIGLEKTAYLPLAFNPNVFFADETHKKDRLLFIGAWSQDRQELIEQIPVPLTIYGKGWHQLQKADCITHPHNIPLTDVAQLYRQHKFVLNVINKNNIRQGMNMRCFEAPACGCILVSEYVKDLELVFDTQEEIICFSNPDELAQSLRNNKIIPEIAHNKVLNYHSYLHRVKQITQ
ncbi:glycosyltransferase, partial [Acinetobacter sp.]